jgi:hypothetical protein
MGLVEWLVGWEAGDRRLEQRVDMAIHSSPVEACALGVGAAGPRGPGWSPSPLGELQNTLPALPSLEFGHPAYFCKTPPFCAKCGGEGGSFLLFICHYLSAPRPKLLS